MWITIILLASLLIRIFLYPDHSILWDPAVYLSMGKYIYSLGQSGLWESIRPPIWPLILGFFWKIKINPILWGRACEILFGLGIVFLVYLIGKLVYGKKTGLLAAIFTGFSPLYLYLGNCLYSDITATFLALSGIYCFFKDEPVISGFLLGLCFLTRFPTGIMFVCLAFIAIIGYKKKGLAALLKLSLGFLLLSSGFMIFNFYMYGHAFHPFIMAGKTIKAYSDIWHQGIAFYSVNLFIKENLYLIFVPLGLFFTLKNRGIRKMAIMLTGMAFFVYLHTLDTKLMRYLIPALPFLYLIAGYGIVETYKSIGRYKKIFNAAVILSIPIWGGQIIQQVNYMSQEKTETVFQQYIRYIEQHKEKINGEIWISDPRMLAYSDLKADRLIYYPYFDSNKAEELRKNIDKAGLILFNTMDFPCVLNDGACKTEKIKLLQEIKKQLYEEFYVKKDKAVIGIFRRK